MRLILAAEQFKLGGLSFPGFPLVLDDQMRIVETAHEFLVHICLRSGRVQSKASWKRYGRDLYDFFGYVNANGLDWKSSNVRGSLHPAESYRHWALTECHLSRRTVNARLRTILRFYKWAVAHRIIEELPFEETVVRVPTSDLLMHTSGQGGLRVSSQLLLRESRQPIHLLTLEQCRECLASLRNPTHQLIFRLALQTGLRNAELRSFPAEYVFDPMRRPTLIGKAHCRIRLSPVDQMELKGSKARSIDVPLPLLSDLWRYRILDRPKRIRRWKTEHGALFTTQRGGPYSDKAIEKVFDRLATRVGFNVTPHVLRHTYATLTLHGLRERGYKGDALLYVRDRLGHQSVATTQIYLHLLEQLDTNLMMLHEQELVQLGC